MTEREQSDDVASSGIVNVRLLATVNDWVDSGGDVADREGLQLGWIAFVTLTFDCGGLINGIELVGGTVDDTTVAVGIDIGSGRVTVDKIGVEVVDDVGGFGMVDESEDEDDDRDGVLLSGRCDGHVDERWDG